MVLLCNFVNFNGFMPCPAAIIEHCLNFSSALLELIWHIFKHFEASSLEKIFIIGSDLSLCLPPKELCPCLMFGWDLTWDNQFLSSLQSLHLHNTMLTSANTSSEAWLETVTFWLKTLRLPLELTPLLFLRSLRMLIIMRLQINQKTTK